MEDICGGSGKRSSRKKEEGAGLPHRISVENTPARKVSEPQAQVEKNSCKELNIIGIIEKSCSIMFEG